MRNLVVCMALMALLFAGCGDGATSGDPSRAAASEAPTSAEPATTPEPPGYVENETCRTGMAPVVDTMLANEQKSLSMGVFQNRFNQLDKRIDVALAACSRAVENPARRVMYYFALANAWWGLCDDGDGECTAKLTKYVQSGIGAAHRAEAAVTAQTQA